MTDTDSIRSAIKAYILQEFLPDEDPADLSDDTELLTTGILDSIANIKLVAFLENKFSIQIKAHEVDVEYLNRICDMASLVRSKLDGSQS